jgi:hypothetical protein
MATAAAVRMLQQTGHLQVLSAAEGLVLVVVSQHMKSCCRTT